MKQRSCLFGLGRIEAVALHDAYDRKGVLQGDFLVAIFCCVVELLKAREQQGFDDCDFFRQLYRIKFKDEVLQRGLPLRELQRTVGHVVSFIPERRGDASCRQRCGAPLPAWFRSSGRIGDICPGHARPFAGLAPWRPRRGRRAEPEHAAVLHLKNIERRTCHLYPRFTALTDRDFFQRGLFLPGNLRALRCFFPPQLAPRLGRFARARYGSNILLARAHAFGYDNATLV